MKNFSIHDLRLVNPIAFVGREAHMRASHAQDVLDGARVFTSLHAALDKTDVTIGTTAQRALSATISNVKGTCALVFGREGTGLNNDELNRCDVVLTITASPVYPTLNIS